MLHQLEGGGAGEGGGGWRNGYQDKMRGTESWTKKMKEDFRCNERERNGGVEGGVI